MDHRSAREIAGGESRPPIKIARMMKFARKMKNHLSVNGMERHFTGTLNSHNSWHADCSTSRLEAGWSSWGGRRSLPGINLI
jgi:hypothetical protein